MNKTIKILICVVVGVWVLALSIIAVGNMLGYNPRKQQATEAPPTFADTVYQPQTEPSSELYIPSETSTEGIVIDIITDVAPVTTTTTQPFSIEIPSDNGNITTYKSDEAKKLEVPQGNKAIGEALVSAINLTKATKGFTAVSKEKADFTIDSVTGGNAVKGIVEDLINKAGNKPEANYSFSNGVDQNGSSETPNSVIPPMNSTASVSESAIKSASAVQNADGGYDITLVLNDESQTLQQKAVNHGALFNAPDITSFELPSGFKMSQLNFNYTNATINASVNSDGRLTSINYSLPISQGVVQGTMMIATIDVSLHGIYTASVNITY